MSVGFAFLASGCEGPAGACEDLERQTCNDVRRANCTWTQGKVSKEKADELTKSHKFNEAKTCSDLGYSCSGGVCKKK